MMVAVFATMFIALALAFLGRKLLAILSMAACLVLAIGLFLYEVYSPDYGFRMPWIKTQIDGGPQVSFVTKDPS